MKHKLLGASAMLSVALCQAQDLASCARITEDASRLACYDSLARRPEDQERRELIPHAPTTETLSQRWELDDADKLKPFMVRPYQPTYILPVFHASQMNDRPGSPTRQLPSGASVPYEQSEVKFQLSFKTKIVEQMLAGRGDLWFGYTQQANWQLYSNSLSSPFREIDYMPEVFGTFRMQDAGPGWRWRMLNVGVLHQSNGRSEPLSRSWNRLYAQFGFEKGNWTVLFKPWIRLWERSSDDDNPDIADFLGRAQLISIHRWRDHVFSVDLRHSLREGSRSHGAVSLDWAFPIEGRLKGHIQLFSGYGQSLIDYNYRMNAIGLGISLAEWQ